jgi:hypothetical protein
VILNIFLCMVIGACLILIVSLKKELKLTNEQAKGYLEDLRNADAEYDALEQGRLEQEENYEQQFLSFTETIQSQEARIEEMEPELKFHREKCLPFLNNLHRELNMGRQEKHAL